ELGKPEEAIEWYDKALEVDGNNTYAMYNKGVALGELGKPEEALDWFDKALNQTASNNKTDIDIVSNKAFVLGTKLKEYDEALALTDEYLKINPQHKGLLCTTVEVYKQTGYEGIANQYQEQLSKLDPNYECRLIEKVSLIEREAFA
ncbi:MAG TPA: tetratricopeptide repeat protein, partial [Candidatus Nitrosocosmicus sp.]|nr:tetratricopeptide repeat protein [Candidatus Nitrosocosmicus sp.]